MIDVKVGVLIPTRGIERIEFIKNALRLVDYQTVKPHRIEVVGDPPANELCDITYRYKKGYQRFSDVDIIFFWEDDDWYASDYIEQMLIEWDKAGRPDIFGTIFTMYYHLKLKKYFKMNHHQRASAMNTMIKPNKDINWGKDDNPYTDTWLWMQGQKLTQALYEPKTVKSIGMKHGIGMSGGKGHTDNFQRYLNDDHDMYWLRGIVDEESFKFYEELSNKLNGN